jgi:hypothetical protein
MKKFSKHLVVFGVISLLVLPIFVAPVLAQDTFGLGYVDNGLNGALGNDDPRTVVAKIINFALGFLGVIAVAIILFGGFKWMTSAGNEDKVGEAKQMLGAGVIGLIIILAAWAVANFIISNLNNAIKA